jgi:hypothetical protein
MIIFVDNIGFSCILSSGDDDCIASFQNGKATCVTALDTTLIFNSSPNRVKMVGGGLAASVYLYSQGPVDKAYYSTSHVIY